MSSVPRNPDGTYAPHEATILEGNFFQIAIAKDKLRRVLEAPFGADGRIQGFTREDLDWALEVVRQRPGWAEQTLQAMGIRKEQG